MGSVSRNVSRNTADHMARYNVNKLLAELPTPITKNRFPAPPASRPEKHFAGLHTLRFFQAVRYAPSGPPSVGGNASSAPERGGSGTRESVSGRQRVVRGR